MTTDLDHGWIQTISGGRFYPMHPNPADIAIDDIAHGLSNVCRFTGHCTEFYSVAQHSLLVASIVPAEARLWALLHDASEAYICDMARPVKHSPEMAGYRTVEAGIMAAICTRFDLPPDEPACVKVADHIVLATEARDLMPHRELAAWSWLPKPLASMIIPMPPIVARTEFLTAFRAYAAIHRRHRDAAPAGAAS